MFSPRPAVLCLSGLDPTGGAGLQADIETCVALGARALSLLTCNTVQDTHNVQRVQAIDAEMLNQQLRTLLADCPVVAIKIGLLASVEQVAVIASHLRALQRPLVLDPILRAGGGQNLADANLQAALLRELLPLTTVLAPNAAEARRLCPQAGSLAESARQLLAAGAQHVLITGGDEPGETVINSWFHHHGMQTFTWPRLPETFHGAGCTLASAIAAGLAAGLPVADALLRAQVFTADCLGRAQAVGRGRRIPQRLP